MPREKERASVLNVGVKTRIREDHSGWLREKTHGRVCSPIRLPMTLSQLDFGLAHQCGTLAMTTGKYRKKKSRFGSDVASVYQQEEAQELEAARKRKMARLAKQDRATVRT